ncbi:UNVERIFIED_CONTAM: hypothetical protein FKN15_066998 [Acipenser sinensis]
MCFFYGSFPHQTDLDPVKWGNRCRSFEKPISSVQIPGKYEREQALVQEELARIAKRERMAGQESLALAVTRERAQASEEKQKTKVMVKQLERKEAELKRLDAFYKEQLAHLEKKTHS